MPTPSSSSLGDLDRTVESLDPLPSSVALGSVEVALLRWPEEASVRQAMAALGRPRLLLVEPGSLPPESLDGLEDWLRWPPDPAELLLRAQHLGQRSTPVDDHPLVLDDDGVLHRGDRWVAVSDTQLPVLHLLLDNVDRVVPFEALSDAYQSAGGSGHPASVRTSLARISRRVRPLGVEVVSIRRRGMVLRSGPTRR